MAVIKGQRYLHTGRFAILGSEDVKVNVLASISIDESLYVLLEAAGFFECTENTKTNFSTIGPTSFDCFHLEEHGDRCERIIKKLLSKLPEHASQLTKVKEHLLKYRNNWVLVPQQKTQQGVINGRTV